MIAPKMIETNAKEPAKEVEASVWKLMKFHSHVWSESWIIKKAEHQRIDAFKLWCWRRL